MTAYFPSRTRSGFSLLEIVVVLGLIGVISGIGVFYLSSPRIEEGLRSEQGKVEDFVMQARSLAVGYQQPFVINFKPGSIELEPLAKPEVATSETWEESTEKGGLRPLGAEGWPRREVIEPEYAIEVRRWGKEDYQAITGKVVERWVFDPYGLCEPIAVRLSRDQGQNLLSRVFHPLTGLASDEELSIGGN